MNKEDERDDMALEARGDREEACAERARLLEDEVCLCVIRLSRTSPEALDVLARLINDYGLKKVTRYIPELCQKAANGEVV